ncbi:MAG: DNA polymerase III subunit beta [Candidatus Pacebacteria bacterium]|nr:DNA polymerase III subunit beta [Candidatus Paceibacterota bacterium]
MRLSILQNKLKQGLSCVERITIKSSTLPILNNVLLTANTNFLKLSATNLELGIHYWILSKVEEPGQIPVPANIFSSFINYLPSTSLNLKTEKNNLLFEYGNTKSRIQGHNAEDFPIIPEIEKQEKVSIKSFPLCEGLSKIINISSFSSIRPEISGIYFHFQKDLLTIAATDSFRLGEKKIFFKKPINITKEYSFILPQKAVAFLISVFENKETDLIIYFSQNLIMFESLMEETDHPKIQFISKLIEGEYPKYEEIIPKSYKIEAIINRKEFLTQVKTAGLFAGRINEMKVGFYPKDQKIEISCKDPDLGEHLSGIQAKIKGEETMISFNYKFLLDGLQSLKSDEIIFALSKERSGEEGPGILRPIGDETYLYVVMPIQAS